MEHNGWTDAQLDAMTSSQRKKMFEDGFVCDLGDAPPELVHEALTKIRQSLSAG